MNDMIGNPALNVNFQDAAPALNKEYAMNILHQAVILLTGPNHTWGPFMQLTNGIINDQGMFDRTDSEHDPLYLCIAPHEMINAIISDGAKRGHSLQETGSACLRNIRKELQQSRAWVHTPSKPPGVHRFSIGNYRPANWWIMKYHDLPTEWKSLFLPLFHNYTKSFDQVIPVKFPHPTSLAPLPDAHLNNLQAEIQTQDYATAPPEKLPPPHHGLVFPEDRRLIEFISRYLPEAIRLLGKGEEAPAFQELEQRFEQLRHFARQHSRTDEELIQSIIAFGRLYYLNSEGIIAAVKTSIQASAVAEN
jgi:hypothetical protein